MAERESTGISELDDLIEGGFKKGAVVLIEGTAGSGKSTLAVHFCRAGIEKQENCLYLSIEEEKDSFFENLSRYGFNLPQLESENKFFFRQLTSSKLKDFIDKGIIGVEDVINQNKITRVVIDSISAFSLLYDTEAHQRVAVQRLFEKLRVWNLTTIIIAEDSQDYKSFGLPYLVDGVLKLSYNKIGRQRVRTIEVLKMRGTKHRSTEVVYRIEDNGISLYPGETILES